MSKKQYILTYNKHQKGWRKVYKGHLLWCGYASAKRDRDAYRRAVANFREQAALIDQGLYTAELADVIRQQNIPTKKKSKKQRWNPKRVTSCLRKFLEAKQAEVNAKKISPSRHSDLKYRLGGFKEYFSKKDMNRITERDITKFQIHEAKKVSTGQLKISSLGQDYKAIRQFFNWCWKQRIINERPRNLDELAVTIPRKQLQFFTKNELQKLMTGCDKSQLDSKWQNRESNEVDFDILKAMILLGINMGYTQMDVSTLQVQHCHFTTRPARCIKNRSKTGVQMNHLMWKQTRDLLKKHCEGKNNEDLVFTRPDGRPLVPFSVDADGNITGGRSDYLGNKFRRLVQRTFNEDDTRRLRELRRTGANFCKKKQMGLEKLYLGHKDSGMSALYTDPAQKKLDTALCFAEMDFGFTDVLQPYYEGRNRRKTK